MIEIKKGERRIVAIEVFSKKSDPFIISSSDYSVLNADEDVIEHGIPTIEGHKINALIDSNNLSEGYYTVKFKYTIETEILIALVRVAVR